MNPVTSFAAKRLLSAAGFAFLVTLVSVTPTAAQSWTRVSGIDTTRGVYSLATVGPRFFAATDSLIYRSDDGVAWHVTPTQPAAGLQYYILHAQDSVLFAGTEEQGVHRSLDGGATWTSLGTELPAEGVLGLTALGDSLYAGLGFSAIYVLNLKAPGAWVPYTTGLTQFGTNWLGAAGGRLFAGMGSGLFVRDRGGDRWREASWGDGLQRQAFEVAAIDTFLFAATEAGVFRARQSEPLAWQARDIGPMKGNDILALAVHGKRLYAGLNRSLQHWIWSSDDAGETWEVRAHEFTEIWEMRLAGSRMWAARTDGLWYYDFETVSVRSHRKADFARRTGFEDGWRIDGRRVRGVRQALPQVVAPAGPVGEP